MFIAVANPEAAYEVYMSKMGKQDFERQESLYLSNF